MLLLLLTNCYRGEVVPGLSTALPTQAWTTWPDFLTHILIYNIFAVTELNTVFRMILATEPEEMCNEWQPMWNWSIKMKMGKATCPIALTDILNVARLTARAFGGVGKVNKQTSFHVL